MPVSIYQITLRSDFIQAEFHPIDHSLIALFGNGDLKGFDSRGHEAWSYSLPCRPIVFRISSGGNLLVILGKGVLVLFNIRWPGKTKTISVDEQLHILELYKNYALLGGYQKSITMMDLNKKEQRELPFNFFIHKIKSVPFSDRILIYHENKDLQCCSLIGESSWSLEKYDISGDIEVSNKGDICLFIQEPFDLIRFDVLGYLCFKMTNQTYIKDISLSLSGDYFMMLDVENRLTFHDKQSTLIWKSTINRSVSQIKLSCNGGYFIAIDDAHILTCYQVDASKNTIGHFLELKDEKRVHDKRCEWSLKPGRALSRGNVRLLTANCLSSGIGLVGQDGEVYFLDETGQIRMNIAPPTHVQGMGLCDAFELGYVFGESWIQTINFQSETFKHVSLYDISFKAPVVNFFHKKMMLIAPNMEAFIYDFEGKTDRCIPLSIAYQNGISCEKYGFVLFDAHHLLGVSEQGKTLFKLKIEETFSDIHLFGHWTLATTDQSALISIDLSSMAIKEKKFNGSTCQPRIVSVNPLLVTEEDRLIQLHPDLSVISTHQIQSNRSIFYLDEGQLYEVIRSHTGLRCYDENGNMVWRCQTADPICEHAITQNGIVLMTDYGIDYVRLKKGDSDRQQFVRFLDI